MSRDLPARASLEHLKKQAKELLRGADDGSAEAVERLRTHAGRDAGTPPRLADAQHTIAREYGFATWTALREHLEARAESADPFAALAAAVRADDVPRAESLFRRHPELRSRLEDAAPGGAFGERILSCAVRTQGRAMIDLLLRHGADIDGRSHWWAGSFGLLDGCDPELAPFLIERGATVDAHAAARLGLLDRLAALLAADPSLVHARGGDGQTPLHVAKTLAVAQLLVEHGADVDARDVDHESTPAQYLIGDRPEIVRWLVDRGCATDILMAAALGDVELVRRHLDANPDAVRMRVSSEWFPMRHVHAGGTIYIWTLGNGKTPHAVARARGHDAVLELLLARSPDDVRLTEACTAGDDAALAALRAREPNLAAALPDSERRALVEAAWNEDDGCVRRMLEAGWPAGARDEHGTTALHNAAWLGNAPMVRELLRHRAPLDAVERRYGMRPLGWALHGSLHSWRAKERDYAAVVEALLDAGAEAPPLTPELDASDAVRALLRRRATPR